MDYYWDAIHYNCRCEPFIVNNKKIIDLYQDNDGVFRVPVNKVSSEIIPENMDKILYNSMQDQINKMIIEQFFGGYNA